MKTKLITLALACVTIWGGHFYVPPTKGGTYERGHTSQSVSDGCESVGTECACNRLGRKHTEAYSLCSVGVPAASDFCPTTICIRHRQSDNSGAVSPERTGCYGNSSGRLLSAIRTSSCSAARRYHTADTYYPKFHMLEIQGYRYGSLDKLDNSNITGKEVHHV